MGCNPWGYKESDSRRTNTLISLFEPRAHAPQLEKSSCASTREKSVGHSEDLQRGKSEKKKKRHFAQHLTKTKLLQLLTNSTLGASDEEIKLIGR